MSITERLDQIADNPRLLDVMPLHATLSAVLALHSPRAGYGTTVCDGCSEQPYDGGSMFMEYPCPTVRTVADTLGAEL